MAKSNYGDTVKNSEISISDAKAEITVGKTGDFSVYKLSFKMDMIMSVEGQTITTSTAADYVIEFQKFDADVTITPPEGYQNFEEVK